MTTNNTTNKKSNLLEEVDEMIADVVIGSKMQYSHLKVIDMLHEVRKLIIADRERMVKELKEARSNAIHDASLMNGASDFLVGLLRGAEGGFDDAIAIVTGKEEDEQE